MPGMPLTDKLARPIHDLRISVIDRCNFRCPYCMPEAEYSKHYTFLKEHQWLKFDEIIRLTQLFVNLGVSKVRISGGEPLLRPDLPKLIQGLKKIDAIEDLALTTNGSRLSECARDLKEAGLDRITVSLDTLDEQIFQAMSGEKGDMAHVIEGFKVAQRAGFSSMKINVVIQKGVNDHSILHMVNIFKNTPHVLRFIEYMDVGNCNHWQSENVVPSKEIVTIINQSHPIEPVESTYFGEVAQRYRFKDGSGEIGFISSITQPFCQSCTRARLSTDGKLFTCLFAENGTDLRSPLREGASDSELSSIIRSAWQQRDDRYSELRSLSPTAATSSNKVEMFQIGG